MSMEITHHNGIFYPINNNKCAVINAMLKDRQWEKKIATVMEQYIRPDWICLDIGANIGLHTMLLAELGQYVIGFEPHPIVFTCLKKTLNCKGHNNAEIHNVALSNQRGVSRLWTNNDGQSSLDGIRNHRFQWNYHVDTRPLDDYDIPKVDFMKIDVEGSEFQVLEGAIGIIEKHRPLIILETFKTNKNKERLEIFCKRFGYSRSYISADNYLLRHEHHKARADETFF